MNNIDGKLIPFKNLSVYWLDENTFCFVFDGQKDEDGDEYSVSCEYQKDKDKFIFERLYDCDVTKTYFTEEQKEYIKNQMKQYMESREE